jgi:hypothetical protein
VYQKVILLSSGQNQYVETFYTGGESAAAANRLPITIFKPKMTAAATTEITTINQRLYLLKKDSVCGNSMGLGAPVGPSIEGA